MNSHISTLDSCFGCISSQCLFLLTGRCVTSCHESWDLLGCQHSLESFKECSWVKTLLLFTLCSCQWHGLCSNIGYLCDHLLTVTCPMSTVSTHHCQLSQNIGKYFNCQLFLIQLCHCLRVTKQSAHPVTMTKIEIRVDSRVIIWKPPPAVRTKPLIQKKQASSVDFWDKLHF